MNSDLKIPLVIRKAAWQNDEDRSQLQSIRRQVFLEEQQVPIEDEWDGKDDLETTLHYLAFTTPGDKAIACLRILKTESTWKIGRVAVMAHQRKKGVAEILMLSVISKALETNIRELILESQLYITPFYESLGFQICSEVFMDAGIKHVRMKKKLI